MADLQKGIVAFAKVTGALVLLMATVACGTIPTRAGYAQQMNEWHGKDVNDLLAQLGVPNKSLTMPNGNKLYTYIISYNESSPYFSNQYYQPGRHFSYTDPGGQQHTIVERGHWVHSGISGGGSVHYQCTTNFVIDSKTKLVDSVTFEGNACVALPRKTH